MVVSDWISNYCQSVKEQHDSSSTIQGSMMPGANESIIRWSDLSASQDLQQLFWDSNLKGGGRGGMGHLPGGGAGVDGSGNNNNAGNNNGQDDMDDPNMCFQQQIKLEPGGNGSGSSGGSRSHHALQKGIFGTGGANSLSPTFHFQQQQQHNFNRWVKFLGDIIHYFHFTTRDFFADSHLLSVFRLEPLLRPPLVLSASHPVKVRMRRGRVEWWAP